MREKEIESLKSQLSRTRTLLIEERKMGEEACKLMLKFRAQVEEKEKDIKVLMAEQDQVCQLKKTVDEKEQEIKKLLRNIHNRNELIDILQARINQKEEATKSISKKRRRRLFLDDSSSDSSGSIGEELQQLEAADEVAAEKTSSTSAKRMKIDEIPTSGKSHQAD